VIVGHVEKYKNRDVAVHVTERRTDSGGRGRDYPICGSRVDLDAVTTRDGTLADVTCVRCKARAEERNLT